LEDRRYVQRLMAEVRRSDQGPLRAVVPPVMMGTNCTITGFRNEVGENCALLGYSAADSGLSYRRFGTIYRSQLQWSRVFSL
jgi:hypothetical protein